eukprot:1656075-Alexandrium_andersonii.AAC.1
MESKDTGPNSTTSPGLGKHRQAARSTCRFCCPVVFKNRATSPRVSSRELDVAPSARAPGPM